MGREFHVRFCEGLGVKFPRATRLIITGTSEALLRDEVQPLVEQFLSERGLRLSPEKTRITHIEDGFEFLGQTIRRHKSGKVLLIPSKKSVKGFLAEIREEIRRQGGHRTAGELIQALNAKIRGWTLYHRHASSSRIFSKVDHWIIHRLIRWCRKRHRNKSWKWIKKKYFKQIGGRSWVFTGTRRDRDGKTYPICLLQAGEMKIERQVKVCGEANPYDPQWETYFEERSYRKMQSTLLGRMQIRSLHREQQGRCPVCKQPLGEEEEWHLHHRVKRSCGGDDRLSNLELLHATCHRQHHVQEGDEGSRVSQEAFEEA